MKISKKQLKRIIKEEIGRVLEDVDPGSPYELYIYSPIDGIHHDDVYETIEEAIEDRLALERSYPYLVAIFDKAGTVVRLGQGIDADAAKAIKSNYDEDLPIEDVEKHLPVPFKGEYEPMSKILPGPKYNMP